eukprot:370077_1
MLSVVFFILHTLSIHSNGQYDINTWNTTIINTANNHKIPLTIHYPSNTNQTYPLMIFYHGWECMNTWYDFIWQSLVPKGLIIAMPNDYTENNTTNENKCAISQRYTLDWIKKSCNINKSCPLYNIVGNKSIAIGHSMGGGTTFLSSSSNYSLGQNFEYSFDAAFTLSGCGDTTDILQAIKYIDIPIFVFTATHDCMCPPETTAIPYYNTLPNNTCRFLADITNGSHCGFMNAPQVHQDACNVFDVSACPTHNHKNIALQTQIDIVMQYLTSFVNATMNDDNNEQDFQRIGMQLQKDEVQGVMTVIDSSC